MREKIRLLEYEFHQAKSVDEIDIVINKIRECLTEIETKVTTPTPTDLVCKGLLSALLETCETQRDIFAKAGKKENPAVAKKSRKPKFIVAGILIIAILSIPYCIYDSIYKQTDIYKLSSYYKSLPDVYSSKVAETMASVRSFNKDTELLDKYFDKHLEYALIQMSHCDEPALVKQALDFINNSTNYQVLDLKTIQRLDNSIGYYNSHSDWMSNSEDMNDGTGTKRSVTLNGDFSTVIEETKYHGAGMLKWIDGIYYDRYPGIETKESISVFWRGIELGQANIYDSGSTHQFKVSNVYVVLNNENTNEIYYFDCRIYKKNYGTNDYPSFVQLCSNVLTKTVLSDDGNYKSTNLRD